MYLGSASKALRAGRDVYGTGEPKIGSIFCTRARQAGAGPCDLDRELAINVTYITSGDIGIAGRRLTFNFWVHRPSLATPLRPFGTGMSLPPNHVLIPHDGAVVFEDGTQGMQTWYAWTP